MNCSPSICSLTCRYLEAFDEFPWEKLHIFYFGGATTCIVINFLLSYKCNFHNMLLRDVNFELHINLPAVITLICRQLTIETIEK